jgi:predicted nucleotidyltransferase
MDVPLHVVEPKAMKSPDLLNRELAEKCNRYGVVILYAFGSRAKEIKEVLEGRATSVSSTVSDADIGVKLRPATSLSVRDKVRLSTELEDLLEVNRVDLCVLQEADPFLAADVIRGERIYCENEYRADEYDLYVLRRAGDLIQLERERLSLVFKESRGT